jgi:hypothetical protein
MEEKLILRVFDILQSGFETGNNGEFGTADPDVTLCFH